jgi:hypothetical protein
MRGKNSTSIKYNVIAVTIYNAIVRNYNLHFEHPTPPPPPKKKISHAQVCEECEEMNFFFNELTEMVKQVGIEKILHPEFTFKNEIVSKDNTVKIYLFFFKTMISVLNIKITTLFHNKN